MQLPRDLLTELERKAAQGWSGTIALNLKDGRVIAYEVTEKHRIASIV